MKHPTEGVEVSPMAKAFVVLRVPGPEVLRSSCVCPHVTGALVRPPLSEVGPPDLLYLLPKGAAVPSSNSCLVV